MMYRTWQEHFFEYVMVGDGCWGWTGVHDRYGYGLWQPAGEDATKHGLFKKRIAHRVMWEILRGPIPDGLDLDHLCRFKGCVNPDHLEPVTRRENLLRAKIYCKQGHRLVETRRANPCGRSYCGSCYDDRLARDRAARLARGHRRPGRKKKAMTL